MYDVRASTLSYVLLAFHHYVAPSPHPSFCSVLPKITVHCTRLSRTLQSPMNRIDTLRSTFLSVSNGAARMESGSFFPNLASLVSKVYCSSSFHLDTPTTCSIMDDIRNRCMALEAVLGRCTRR
ncbi:hypothetical protein B0H12DRAFT_450727 [Mycena haematopus]|nr:hypothetical protein B0H12DRAFT_450727 [Mycena haematopus]